MDTELGCISRAQSAMRLAQTYLRQLCEDAAVLQRLWHAALLATGGKQATGNCTRLWLKHARENIPEKSGAWCSVFERLIRRCRTVRCFGRKTEPW